MHLTVNECRSLCLNKIEEVQKNVENIENKIDKREMEQICEQFVMGLSMFLSFLIVSFLILSVKPFNFL